MTGELESIASIETSHCPHYPRRVSRAEDQNHLVLETKRIELPHFYLASRLSSSVRRRYGTQRHFESQETSPFDVRVLPLFPSAPLIIGTMPLPERIYVRSDHDLSPEAHLVRIGYTL